MTLFVESLPLVGGLVHTHQRDTREHVDAEDVGMARRRSYSKDPVAERQRKLVIQGVAFTLLFAFTTFVVFMAVTSG